MFYIQPDPNGNHPICPIFIGLKQTTNYYSSRVLEFIMNLSIYSMPCFKRKRAEHNSIFTGINPFLWHLFWLNFPSGWGDNFTWESWERKYDHEAITKKNIKCSSKMVIKYREYELENLSFIPFFGHFLMIVRQFCRNSPQHDHHAIS